MNALLKDRNERPFTSSVKERTSSTAPLVLVVEDHDDTRLMLRYLLELRGYRVIEAADGEAAVQLAERAFPQLIVMDVSLPRMDGLAATRRIREQATLQDVPVVFLSGHAHPHFRATALAIGGSEYLVKPLRLSELEQTVDRHLRRGVALDAADRTGASS